MNIEQGGMDVLDLESHWQGKFGVNYPECFPLEEQRRRRRVIAQAIDTVLYITPIVHTALWKMIGIKGVVVFGSAAREDERYGLHTMSDADLQVVGEEDCAYDALALLSALVAQDMEKSQVYHQVSLHPGSLWDAELGEIARGADPLTAHGYFVVTRDHHVSGFFPWDKIYH